jgi:hypothetical protein
MYSIFHGRRGYCRFPSDDLKGEMPGLSIGETESLRLMTFTKDLAGRRLCRLPGGRITPPLLLWHLTVD